VRGEGKRQIQQQERAAGEMLPCIYVWDDKLVCQGDTLGRNKVSEVHMAGLTVGGSATGIETKDRGDGVSGVCNRGREALGPKLQKGAIHERNPKRVFKACTEK